MTLVEFLEARIREDEAAARTSVDDPVFGTAEKWEIEPDGPHYLWHTGLGIMVAGSVGDNCIAPAQAEHTVRWDPARVLAECASKRAIIKDHAATATAHSGQGHNNEPACRQCTTSVDEGRVTVEWDVAERVVAPCDTLRFLALPYADHPDYDEAWRP